MIKPTPGRVLWFYTNGADVIGSTGYGSSSPAQHVPASDAEHPLAATVTYVHSDTMVNLTVHDQNGNTYGVTSITLVQDDAVPGPGQAYCTWMPFQQGQAKLTATQSQTLNTANAEALAPGTMVPSTDPARLQNNPPGGAPGGDNTVRHDYRILTPAEIQSVKDIKDQGLALVQTIQAIGHSEELGNALRYARQAVMWAVAHVTK